MNFGYAPMRFLRQIRSSVRAGTSPAEHLRGLPSRYVAEPPRLDAPWTFVAGTRNRLFTCESQQRTHAFFGAGSSPVAIASTSSPATATSTFSSSPATRRGEAYPLFLSGLERTG